MLKSNYYPPLTDYHYAIAKLSPPLTTATLKLNYHPPLSNYGDYQWLCSWLILKQVISYWFVKKSLFNNFVISNILTHCY